MDEQINGYFKMMQDICKGYHIAKTARKHEKEALMKAEDWDGVKAWNEREKHFPVPFSEGYMSAYWAWQNSIANESLICNHVDALEVSRLPWNKDAHDFIACLEEAGITEFAITDNSSALMELLHTLADEGCEMVGLCKVTRKGELYGVEGTATYNGILMRIK